VFCKYNLKRLWVIKNQIQKKKHLLIFYICSLLCRCYKRNQYANANWFITKVENFYRNRKV
jgi:hypothetical protein